MMWGGNPIHNLLTVLLEETPRMQASSLRVMLDLKARQTPYWKSEFRLFQKQWSRLTDSLNTMLSQLGANCIQTDEDAKDQFHQPCNFAQEETILISSVLRIRKQIVALPLPWICEGGWKEKLQVFLENWICVLYSLKRFINPVTLEDDIYYCCELQCFPVFKTDDHVDGIACEKCMAYSFCHCDCDTYMKYMHDTHCCPLFCCQPKLGECILCPGPCLCQCNTHQKKILLPNSKTIRKHRRVVEVVEYQGVETHCCDKKCIPIPNRIIRGLACLKCKAVNYCKCMCTTRKGTLAHNAAYTQASENSSNSCDSSDANDEC